eukprot:CAMPEP_0197531040 /NCGR_PEP_ID=MMETSP1318-20131121/33881_1 /TAXON_ID=552666 /ORGANISM="Partenskyella glossopodia, Strain RCC365" /LENGTH=435 /DNA_ID=CAMNT_0043087109 /DNA_START=81 /DNA_END=1384 /DNA_ORIENTATION=+
MLTAADWLQGPYLYALYDSYGHSKQSIGHLFILGFGTAAVCSTFVGSLADKYGRKRLCQAYCLLMILSLMTKHSSSWGILAVGRVLGGAATSILFSSFESWMVHQHLQLSYPDHWMRRTFEVVVSGTGITAMTSGLVATFFTSHFGRVAPFDLAIALAALGLLLLSRAWPENYGDAGISVIQTLENSYHSIRGDPVIMLLGISQALYEAGMYTFVIMWTPALDSTSALPVSHGWVFSTFMLCIILGGTLYKQYLAYGGSVEKLMLFTCGIGAVSLAIPVVINEHSLLLLSFFVFETSVGVFWPSASSLRSMYFPEDTRASVMATLRVPQNILIMCVLSVIGRLENWMVFSIAFVFMTCAAVAQWYFIKITTGETDVIEELGIVDENITEGKPSAAAGSASKKAMLLNNSSSVAGADLELASMGGERLSTTSHTGA